MADKVIITCAITGSIHTPTMSPYLPWTPDEIARHAIDAAEAGAAILHFHARVPENGFPTGDPDMYMRYLPQVKAATNAVINLTTGGSVFMSLEDRIAGAKRVKPEMASLHGLHQFFHTSAGAPLQRVEICLGTGIPGPNRGQHLQKYFCRHEVHY